MILVAFALPAAGLALLALPLLAWVLLARDRRRAERLQEVVGRRFAGLAPEWSPARVRLRTRLALLGLALCVVAWMQPRFGDAGAVATQTGTDLCVCLDVSRSMLARDLPPSRLEFAHAAIAELAARTRGDRLALVLFAGEAKLRVPLTRDVDSFAGLAQSASPVDVPLGGTDLGAAVDAAVRALAAGSGASDDAPLEGAILLVTDGEDTAGSGREAAARARARGLRVHCVGLGSALGSKITLVGPDGQESFLRDRAGNEVVSRLDAASLRALAAAGGGLYLDGGSVAASLASVYERGVIPELRPRQSAAGAGAVRANRYRIPLGLGVLLLLGELALAPRGRRRTTGLEVRR